MQICFSPDQDHAASAAQDQGRVGFIVGCTELAQTSMVSEVNTSPVSSPWLILLSPAISGDGHDIACLAGQRDSKTIIILPWTRLQKQEPHQAPLCFKVNGLCVLV